MVFAKLLTTTQVSVALTATLTQHNNIPNKILSQEV